MEAAPWPLVFLIYKKHWSAGWSYHLRNEMLMMVMIDNIYVLPLSSYLAFSQCQCYQTILFDLKDNLFLCIAFFLPLKRQKFNEVFVNFSFWKQYLMSKFDNENKNWNITHFVKQHCSALMRDTQQKITVFFLHQKRLNTKDLISSQYITSSDQIFR